MRNLKFTQDLYENGHEYSIITFDSFFYITVYFSYKENIAQKQYLCMITLRVDKDIF